MKQPKHLSVIAACALGLALGGCGGLLTSDRPAATTWWLEPIAPAGETTAAPFGAGLDLEVTVVPGLDTDRILTLGPDAQLSPLAGAHWADNLPDVLESVLLRSFQAADGNEAVAEEGGDREPGCLLRVEFREFFARLDAAGEVRSVQISVTAQMRCGRHAKPYSMVESVGVDDRSRAGIVAAFQQGLDTLTRMLRAELFNLASAGRESGR